MRLDQLQLGLGPVARVKRDRDVAFEQRLQRAFEEALGAALRRVALANDCEPHQPGRVSASSDASAAWTRTTGSVVRH
jgi:hypothetical protein